MHDMSPTFTSRHLKERKSLPVLSLAIAIVIEKAKLGFVLLSLSVVHVCLPIGGVAIFAIHVTSVTIS